MLFKTRLALPLLLLWSTAPVEAGDAKHGAVIAKRWCASCHVVASDQTTAKVDAPPFSDIAARRSSDKALAAFLTDPHPKMPDMSLTRKEIDDIVSYIRTLDAKAPAPPRSPDADPAPPKNG
jgi:mono/diheme cytochrome c family protein